MILTSSQLTFHHEHNIIFFFMRYRFEALNICVCVIVFVILCGQFGCLTTLLLYACQNPYLFYKLGFGFLIFGERDDGNMFPYWFDCRYDGINHVLALADGSHSPHKNYIKFNLVFCIFIKKYKVQV